MELLAILLIVAFLTMWLTKDDPGRLWIDALALGAAVAFVTSYATDLIQWVQYLIPIAAIALGREWWRQRLYRRSRTVYLRESTNRDRL